MLLETKKKTGIALILLGPVILVVGFLVYFRYGFGGGLGWLMLGSLGISLIMVLIGFIMLLSWYSSRE
ncbi:MAG: hypothetical protein ACW960_12045 [Candidatus Thorarchaeota archaeon]|jgi:hypothetical protein